MRRREILAALAGVSALGQSARPASKKKSGFDCECAFLPAAAGVPPGSEAFKDVGSKLRITGMKVFGVTLDERLGRVDRPYVFVKLETNQGVFGWGEATLEGKASAAMACVNDLRDFIVGSDPMQSEHLYQLMYIGSFYRGGPVLGSAISGIDQAIWDIRGRCWECRCTNCSADPSIRAACVAITTLRHPPSRMRARCATKPVRRA
jgi:galactonate dehydratase